MRHRVLLVDDSEVFIAAATAAIASDPELVVCGSANTADDIVALVRQLAPDVISLDLHLRGVDGLEAIGLVLDARPTPIVVMTADPGGRDGFLCMQALARGAVEVTDKPDLTTSNGRRALCDALRAAARAQLGRSGLAHTLPRSAIVAAPPAAAAAIVGIASSTGGPAALATILAALPASFGAGIVIVQHLAPAFVHHLVSWLSDVSRLRVRVAADGERLIPGDVLLAPDDAQLTVGRDGIIHLDRRIRLDRRAAPLEVHRPSGTVLLSSLAARGPRAIGVVLSGMGADGVPGLLAIRRAGGATAAQEGASCVVDGMPQAARAAGAAEVTLDPKGIARWLIVEAERRS